jgi:hypothetical protein
MMAIMDVEMREHLKVLLEETIEKGEKLTLTLHKVDGEIQLDFEAGEKGAGTVTGPTRVSQILNAVSGLASR